MERGFWLDRWAAGEIGFHQDQVHPDLLAHADRFLGGGPFRVLVPLCGKSLDLDWLAVQGHQVTGVELSELACRQFHEERGRVASVEVRGAHVIHRSAGLDFVVGDFFEIEGTFDRVWDRAAMVALPPALRPRYLDTVRRVAPGAELLLSTFTYDEAHGSGPPFSIRAEEVLEAYPGAELLSEVDLLDRMPRFKERGHTLLLERTWLARVRG